MIHLPLRHPPQICHCCHLLRFFQFLLRMLLTIAILDKDKFCLFCLHRLKHFVTQFVQISPCISMYILQKISSEILTSFLCFVWVVQNFRIMLNSENILGHTLSTCAYYYFCVPKLVKHSWKSSVFLDDFPAYFLKFGKKWRVIAKITKAWNPKMDGFSSYWRILSLSMFRDCPEL